MKRARVVCPGCGAPMVLRGSRYGQFYGCSRFPECRETHGAHRDTGKPLGIPADKETRGWRMKAHSAFDRLWQSGRMKRKEAYHHIARVLGISVSNAHIGRFTVDQCKALIEAMKSEGLA